MPYTAEISRANPSCILFLIDQSGSMQDSIPTDSGRAGDSAANLQTPAARTKAQGVSDTINRLLQALTIRCAKEEGIRPYFDVGVIGYGAKVGHAFVGQLAGRELVSITEVGNTPARIEERKKKMDDGAGGVFEQSVRFPIWFEPVANGGTPMTQAFSLAVTTLERWIEQHSNSFPPIVINVTDGDSTDGDPSSVADRIKSLATSDGNALLLNVHLSSTAAAPVEFPDSESSLPSDRFAQMLFRMSSPLTSYMRASAQQSGYRIAEGARGFSFNADMVALIGFLEIGTRPGDLR